MTGEVSVPLLARPLSKLPVLSWPYQNAWVPPAARRVVTCQKPVGAQPVVHQEGGVKADERGPEVQLAQGFVQHPAGDLGEPEVDAGEGGEHDGAKQHVVEVGHHEVGVGDMEVEGR